MKVNEYKLFGEAVLAGCQRSLRKEIANINQIRIADKIMSPLNLTDEEYEAISLSIRFYVLDAIMEVAELNGVPERLKSTRFR